MPYANNKGVKIHYEVEGQGPPLVLVHGMGGSMENWRWTGYIQELSKDHRLILVDNRGFGKSDRLFEPSAFEFKNIIGDLVVVLDKLGIDKAGYFGYSMGGKIGYRISIYAPQRFSCLILGGMGYPIAGNEEREDPIINQTTQDLEDALREAPENPMEYFAAAREKRQGAPFPPDRRAILLGNDARSWLAWAYFDRNQISPKAAEVLPKIKVPCLIFTGEADPWYPLAKKCSALMPGAKFISLPGLDHAAAFQRSDMVLPLVKEFLAEVSK